jgi:hypothetical protein
MSIFSGANEFGTYNQVATTSTFIGAGPAQFYSSGTFNTSLTAGRWYILAASWSGPVTTYYFGTGESQNTSFGAYVHGYATGTHPLGTSILSNSNDQAIYYQRLPTVPEPGSFVLALIAAAIAFIAFKSA